MATQEREIGTFISRYNALVDNGWLTVLSEAELKMWMAFARYANRDGAAWPEGATLGRIMGHTSDGHFGTIRRRLEDLGLIEVLDVGGGRGRPCKVQIFVPPFLPENTKAKPPRSGGVSKRRITPPIPGGLQPQTPPNRGENPPDLETKPPRSGEAHKEEQRNEQRNEQLIHPATAPPADEEFDPDDPPDEGGITAVPIEPKGTKFPPGVWRRAIEGVTREYARVHKVTPIFRRRDYRAWSEILSDLRCDLDEFARIVRAALREPEVGRWRGHHPWVIQEDLNYLRSLIAKGKVGHANGNHRQSAEFTPDGTAAPIRIRRVAAAVSES